MVVELVIVDGLTRAMAFRSDMYSAYATGAPTMNGKLSRRSNAFLSSRFSANGSGGNRSRQEDPKNYVKFELNSL